MAAAKEETWIWLAMAAALVAAVWWYRKRKPIGLIPTGVGSTIGSTIANQPSAPLPVSSIPIQGGVPLQYNGSNSGMGGDLAGQVASGLGGSAPVLTTTGTGATTVSQPVFTRPKGPSTPILIPRRPVLAY
jgi:hypothetical protein